MPDNFLWIFLIWIALSIVVGFVGQLRRIGFLNSMLVSIFFTPAIGIIVASLSKNEEDIERDEKILKSLIEISGKEYIKPPERKDIIKDMLS